MTKFLLSILAVALLTGTVCAEDVAGEVPLKPEPTIWSNAVGTVTAGFMRAKGVVLASRVRLGMSPDEVRAILGNSCCTFGGGLRWSDCYFSLGVSVNYSCRGGAGGGPDWCLTGVRIAPLFR